ncbi:MAG TPA: FAD-binding oxidoreductase, partial [Micavibrio sp.]
MNDGLQAKVDEIDDAHPEIRIIRLRPVGQSISWQAGQFMELGFTGFPVRPYSIANAPHNALLEFHIRNNNRGGASQHAVTALETGDILTLRGPLGSAVLPPDDRQPLVLIAGGMGLPPMKAIAEAALHRLHPGP